MQVVLIKLQKSPILRQLLLLNRTNIFNRCENSHNVLLTISEWANVHPLLKVIPVEWEHSIPYGLLYSPQPSAIVKHFLAAAQAATK